MKIQAAASTLLILLGKVTTIHGQNIFQTQEDLDTELPENVSESNPIRLFIQGGQSNCGGAASAELLEADSETYPDLVGTIDGAWFAGKFSSFDDFRIRRMKAGEAKYGKFGPEVSIAQRLVEASGHSTNIMIAKYCWGGSNIKREWNPESIYNNWNRNDDDGTAAWLETNGWADLNSKDHLYANLVYYVRKTTETLDEASIPYEFSGFFWIQGSADKKISTWQEYGDDTVRLFETLRTDLDQPSLPIVDLGGTPHHNLHTGKVYAASVIENGNVSVADWKMAAANPDSCCIPGPSNACTGSTFINYDLFEHYGYDPGFDDSLKPDGHTDKEFHWFKAFPNNQHAEYEGMVLRGQVMANAFVRDFSPEWANLTPDLEENDAQILFPVQKCPEGEKPTTDNVCWMDQSLETTPVIEPDCTCTDDNDDAIIKAAEERDLDNINGCSDVAAACVREDRVGDFVRKHCCETCGCFDDDAAIAEAAAQRGIENINGCNDVVNMCEVNNEKGEFVREKCCATCAGDRRNRKYVRGRALQFR